MGRLKHTQRGGGVAVDLKGGVSDEEVGIQVGAQESPRKRVPAPKSGGPRRTYGGKDANRGLFGQFEPLTEAGVRQGDQLLSMLILGNGRGIGHADLHWELPELGWKPTERIKSRGGRNGPKSRGRGGQRSRVKNATLETM